VATRGNSGKSTLLNAVAGFLKPTTASASSVRSPPARR